MKFNLSKSRPSKVGLSCSRKVVILFTSLQLAQDNFRASFSKLYFHSSTFERLSTILFRLKYELPFFIRSMCWQQNQGTAAFHYLSSILEILGKKESTYFIKRVYITDYNQ